MVAMDTRHIWARTINKLILAINNFDIQKDECKRSFDK